jgi:DNA-binding NarL/FixJ family response regulator
MRSESNSGPCRIALVNDYEVILAGLRTMLAPFRNRVEVVEVNVQDTPDHRVDVALFDTFGQPGLGLDRIKELVTQPHVGEVAVYTWELPEAGRTVAESVGVRGFISKTVSANELVDAICDVADGKDVDTGRFHGVGGQGSWPGARWSLTARESEILALLATGMPNQSIADALFVSQNTVRTHLKAVFQKLQVGNRSQAVAKALSEPSFVTKRTRIFDGRAD